MKKRNPLKRLKMKRLIERCLKDAEFRAQATREEHVLFFLVYMGAHLEYPVAPFQKKIFKWTQKKHFKLIVVAAFRGAGKSTICTVSLPLWLVLGKPAKKYVLIVARTQEQARRLIANIIKEIDENALLKRDLGPLHFDNDEHRRFSIEIGKCDALIQAVSLEQSVRGLKYGAHRPDAIICDDLEDSDSSQTQDNRDALYRRFTGEILPLGDTRTDIVVVGNTVHQDGLILRMGQQIIEGDRHGTFGRFPIMEDGKPLWAGKFKDMMAVEEERRKIGDEAMWRREFLLDPRLDTESIVREEWLHTWHELPKIERGRVHVIGVDLAFSTGPHADYTAIVPAEVYWTENGFEIYILPEILNARLKPLDSKEKVASVAAALSFKQRNRARVFIEDMGAQRIYVDEWNRSGCYAEGISLRGMSKQERMAIAAQYLQKGVIYFPKYGAELLKKQIIGLGIERHDDLADAFTTLVLGVRDISPPSRFSLGELNQFDDKMSKYSQEDRRFFFPDHSDDNPASFGRNILDMRF